jgi:hypothetical protein
MGSAGTPTAYVKGFSAAGEHLAGFDSNERFGCFVAGVAGFSIEVGSTQRSWSLGAHELRVSVMQDEAVRYVVQIHDGWCKRPAPRSLILPQVYALAITEELWVPQGPELARWRNRALLDADLIMRPEVGLARLPEAAPRSARETWAIIGSLVEARAVGGDPYPLPLKASFLVGWSGNAVTESSVRTGKTWLEAKGFIKHVADGRGSFGKPAKLWQPLTIQDSISPFPPADATSVPSETIDDEYTADMLRFVAKCIRVPWPELREQLNLTPVEAKLAYPTYLNAGGIPTDMEATA